jgi:hypothetical protein
MVLLYIGILIWTAVFLIGSYSAIVNGTTWGAWVLGICLWLALAVALGTAMFAI